MLARLLTLGFWLNAADCPLGMLSDVHPAPAPSLAR